nr:immunoglobulin heavy chain junction region [Macaca mulatta]
CARVAYYYSGTLIDYW